LTSLGRLELGVPAVVVTLLGCSDSEPGERPSCPRCTCPIGGSAPEQKPDVNPADLVRPPARPSDGPPADGSRPISLALHAFMTMSAERQQPAGFDIDGLITHVDSTYHCCTSQSVATIDDEGGVDNAAYGLVQDEELNALSNEVALVLEVPTLGAAEKQVRASGSMYVASPAVAPAWDGNDVWDIRSASEFGAGDPSPVLTFPEAYVAEGWWVGTSEGALPLHLRHRGTGERYYNAVLRLHRPTIAVHVASLASGQAAGIVSGVFYEFELLTVTVQTYGECTVDSEAIDLLGGFVANSLDILPTGEQVPGRRCSAASFGAEFAAVPIQRGTSLPGSPVPLTRCE
jgi:hypothetical protein